MVAGLVRVDGGVPAIDQECGDEILLYAETELVSNLFVCFIYHVVLMLACT